MQLATLTAKITPCLLFLCLSKAAQLGDRGKSGDSKTYHRYSCDEEQFIIDELLRYPVHPLPIWGPKIWNHIADIHNQISPSKFPPRTGMALRSHFNNLMLKSKGKLQIPDTLRGRIHDIRNPLPGEDSNPASPTNQELIQISEDEEMVPGSQTTLREFYNLENICKEDQILMRLAMSYSRRGTLCISTWKEIADRIREIRKSNPSHFCNVERSAQALRMRFQRMLQKSVALSQSRQNTKRTMDEEANEKARDPSKRKRLRYTRAEDEFLIEEVLKPTCTTFGSLSGWEKIKLIHDKEVQTNTPGFEQHRTADSLRSRFRDVISRDERARRAIIEKFPRLASEYEATFSITSDLNSPPADYQALVNDNPGSGDMVEELLNAPYDVNFNLLEAGGGGEEDRFLSECISIDELWDILNS